MMASASSSPQEATPPPPAHFKETASDEPRVTITPSDTSSSSPAPAAAEEGLSVNHITTAIAVLLALILLRTGFFNVILVFATSATLLLNPYVRTFLDLPSISGGDSKGSSASEGNGAEARFGSWDPAKYFTAFSFRSAGQDGEGAKDGQDTEQTAKGSDQRTSSDERSSLTPLPPHLKDAMDQLAPLAIRDFVQGWYTHHSFGYPSFPRSVRGTLDYFASSVWTRTLTTNLHSVDVATELLLTGSSVFLTCIRRKRIANAAAQAGDRNAASAVRRGGTGHWNSNEERIASLRAAMRSFFERHLPPNERESDLVFAVLTEILTKQLWNLILTVGEPDFLNRTLVDWKEGQLAAAGGASSTADQTSAPPSVDSPMRPGSSAYSKQAGANIPRPPSTAVGQQPLPAPVSRPSSVAPERSQSAAGGGIPPSFPLPDRNTISSPPSRADSPMMPTFAAAGQQPRMQASTMRTGNAQGTQSADQFFRRPSSGAGQGGSSAMMERRGSAADPISRRSIDAGDGLSAVVGGIGTVFKGAGRGVDALVGGVGDILAGEPTPRAAGGPYRDASMMENQSPSSAWKRDPAAVDRASTHPEVLQSQHNAVRRKQPQGRKDDLTDLMASQAAWPSNLPPSLSSNSPDGDNLPESLRASLRRTGSPPGSGTTGSPASRTMSPGPPRMTSSLPYEISPRSSGDYHSRSSTSGGPRGQSPARSGNATGRSASPVISSQPQATTLLAPRPPSRASQPQPMAPPALPSRSTAVTSSASSSSSSLPPAPSLSSVLSRQDPHGLYDAFESFLEGPPSSASHLTVPGEGEELLRLQIGLGTIERLVPRGSGYEAEMFREDASTILSKAREGLKAAATSSVAQNGNTADALVRTLDRAIARLGFGPEGFEGKEGTVREALDPVHADLTSRLQALYEAFWRLRSEKLQGSKGAKASAPPAQPPSMMSSLAYEPRRKATATPPPLHSRSQSQGHATPLSSSVTGTPTRAAPAPSVMSTAPTPPARPNNSDEPSILRAPKPRQPIIDHLVDLDEDDGDAEGDASESLLGASSNAPAIQVSITDISSNVERPNAQVDVRSFEFICAVDADAGGGGGFVLVRRWAELLTLDKELRRFSTGLRDLPPLPPTKGRTSAMLCADLEGYLAALLSNPELACLPPVEKFADRSRAAAATAANAKGFNPFSSGVELGKNLGKGFVEGVGAVGKAAASGLQQQGATPPRTRLQSGAGLDEGRESREERLSTMTDRSDTAAAATSADLTPTPSSMGGGPTTLPAATGSSGVPASTTSAVASKSSQGLSPRALDALLTSIFALADEALSLTGAWSMRRGVVRLLQSVVRQSYSAAIVSAFDGTASALASQSVAKGLLKARTTLWSSPPPGAVDAEPVWHYQKGAPRSARERIESEEKAREIVLRYAPSQAAFVLGPGGRNACEKALESVHAVVCEDEGALDLVLTLTLRMLQML